MHNITFFQTTLLEADHKVSFIAHAFNSVAGDKKKFHNNSYNTISLNYVLRCLV